MDTLQLDQMAHRQPDRSRQAHSSPNGRAIARLETLQIDAVAQHRDLVRIDAQGRDLVLQRLRYGHDGSGMPGCPLHLPTRQTMARYLVYIATAGGDHDRLAERF